MAEAALFGIATNVLSALASPAFVYAYGRARRIWGAKNELEDLKETIKTIQAKLLDAEKKNTAEVKNWISRVRDVLYDAEDLFDEVATRYMIKQQNSGVKVFFSKQNSVIFRNSIDHKVKDIRNSLGKIASDMAMFGFASCNTEDERWVRSKSRGEETGGFVDLNDVIGRNYEKQVVLDFIYDRSYDERNISLISIVGIGGMGKSTLAQLVYNDEKIVQDFEKNRYWACISNVSDESELIRKIYQSMTVGEEVQYDKLSLHGLQERTKSIIMGLKRKFLLVLDGLWDEDPGRGSKLFSFLSSICAKGTKIIVTTRNSSVSEAYRADKTLSLKGLSSDASWKLFSRFAFTEEQESDPTWIILGQNIVKKCVNVPLAIKAIASLLRVKNTIEEWKSFGDEELSKIEVGDNAIMSTLKLSYDHLPSHLKNCFAYCSLFPKNFSLDKQSLVYMWIAQGYVKPKANETLEATGHAYFIELLRRSLFEEEMKAIKLVTEEPVSIEDTENEGGVASYRMHDLVHDLAQDVSGEGALSLTTKGHGLHRRVRHLCVAYPMDDPLLEVEQLRSCFFISRVASSQLLGLQAIKFRFVHVLDCARQYIEVVPSSIGDLKYLRYLNLSGNSFSRLPDSMTKMVNLLTLDISHCKLLEELPKLFGDLMNLRHLTNRGCDKLSLLPESFCQLKSLEHLSEFRVRTGGGNKVLSKLSLKGKLTIIYDKEDLAASENWNIPSTIQQLVVKCVSGMMRLPTWWIREDPASRMPKLEHLVLQDSDVEQLPPLRCLPCLRVLSLRRFSKLEYVEEAAESSSSSSSTFFPCLVKLELINLPKLQGWSRPVKNEEMFPFLSELRILGCSLLVSIPLAPRLRSLFLFYSRAELLPQLVPASSTTSFLQEILIYFVDGNLESFNCQGLTCLRKIEFAGLNYLREVKLDPNVVKELTIILCPNLKLWETVDREERALDWESFTNLTLLALDQALTPEVLPDCLQQLVSLGQLKVPDRETW